MLLEGDDAVFELVDVVGGAETGLTPCLLAERFGQTPFDLLVAGGETRSALLGVVQVGLQRCAGDGGADAGGVDRLRLGGVDLFEQVAVAVEKAAIRPRRGRRRRRR